MRLDPLLLPILLDLAADLSSPEKRRGITAPPLFLSLSLKLTVVAHCHPPSPAAEAVRGRGADVNPPGHFIYISNFPESFK